MAKKQCEEEHARAVARATEDLSKQHQHELELLRSNLALEHAKESQRIRAECATASDQAVLLAVEKVTAKNGREVDLLRQQLAAGHAQEQVQAVLAARREHTEEVG
jgi:hypothetical protein